MSKEAEASSGAQREEARSLLNPSYPERPHPERRALLRAAAATAPLIATLPSGAALANASAAACVVNDQSASQSGDFAEFALVSDRRGPPDTAVRYLGWHRRTQCGGEERDFFFVETPSGASWYDRSGNSVTGNPDCAAGPLGAGDRQSNDTRIAVLVHWTPDDDFSGVTPAGFFPVTRIERDDVMGITATCLSSVQATFAVNLVASYRNHA